MRRITVAVVVGVLVLGASACGDSSTDAGEAGSGTDASSASPTQAAETTSPAEASPMAPTHAAEPGEPELIQVEGYEYSSLDGMMEKQLQDMVAGFSYIYEDYSGHLVSHDEELLGMLQLIGLTPEGADMTEQDQETMMLGGVEGAMPAIGADTFAMETISGEDVWTAEGELGAGYWWYHEKTLSAFVSVGDPEAAEAFVTAYLAEANG